MSNKPSRGKRLLHALEPAWLLSEARRVRAKLWRKLRRLDERRVTLEPAERARGEVLFSYILDPFLLPPGEPLPHSHTNFWESLTMARAFCDLGYRVDAISWSNGRFLPEKEYDFFVDVRLNMERLAPHLPEHTVKVLHMETAHHAFHNPAQQRRLEALAERRGVVLAPEKMIEPNRAIETADCGTILGNEFTRETYAFGGKPIRRIPISAPFSYPWPTGKDFAAASRRFLWFGSAGLVHKGLDLVLEAFAALPGFHLTVCGPVRREKDFERAYFRELYQTPNIHTHGWIDVGSPAFQRLARSCLGLVYPTCSEGGGGSVLTCMHAALIPVVSREASVDIEPERGVVLPGSTVAEIREAVRELAARPPVELAAMARKAWSFAREHHTRESFERAYRRLAEDLTTGAWPGSASGEKDG